LNWSGGDPEMRLRSSTAAEYAARPDERPLQAELITGLQHTG